MLQSTLEPNKEILGYQLQEKIGAGGFGEVWSALAPGGLLKAVKFVYGFHEEDRAQSELKSLDRVKALRHPFLLSLERIDIDDGKLIVVTELADGSLADCFEQFVEQGEPGIPRDQLIKFLGHAAEALDYLSGEFHLQHLDIKPENLLLVGGHLKVADFGLLKDLDVSAHSLMSGMTPAYAAPELFDGQPSHSSDQYSLAIVYQEMLTGVRPFPGKTPAQLAAQHVHGQPNLTPLSSADRAVIAKALAKNPEHRFRNCQEMVSELSKKRRSIRVMPRRQAPGSRRAADDAQTMMGGSTNPLATLQVSTRDMPFRPVEAQFVSAPRPNPQAPAQVRPTLVIGVGATGCRVAQKYKQRLEQQYRSLDRLPSVGILCLDNDRKNLSELAHQEGPGALHHDELLEAPLKKPDTYRREQAGRFAWLHRRWIYNIPRSLETEGLRPLGRLVFASYVEMLCERIGQKLDQLILPENLAATADTLDLDPGSQQPRILLISSINGGLGSGLTLDLAYTLKLLMQERGLDHGELIGLLVHACHSQRQDISLSVANGLAFLSELRHFAESGYPGDPTLGLPPMENEPPFHWTYMTRLANDLSTEQFEREMDKLAHYVELSSVTPCHQFLDQCRQLEQQLEHYALRTFGLSHWGLAPERLGRFQLRTARELFSCWLRGDELQREAVPHDVESVFGEWGLAVDDVLAKVHGLAQRVPEAIPHIPLATQIEPLLETRDDPFSLLKELWDRALPLSGGGLATPEASARMQTFVQAQAGDLGDQLNEWILQSLSQRSLGLFTAHSRAQTLLQRLQESNNQLLGWRRSCQEQQRGVATLLREIPLAKARTSNSVRSKLEHVVEAYSQQRMAEECFCAGRQLYQMLIDTVQETLEWLESARDRLVKLEKCLPAPASDKGHADLQQPLERCLEELLARNVGVYRQTVEALLFEQLVRPWGSYARALRQAEFWQVDLLAMILEQAHRVIDDAGQQVSLGQLLTESNITPAEWMEWLQANFDSAQPALNDCGGSLRLMTAIPRGADEDTLGMLVEEQFHKQGATLKGTRGEFVLCVEGEDLSLAHLAYRLLQASPQAADLAKRIHTRKDINWASLDSLL